MVTVLLATMLLVRVGGAADATDDAATVGCGIPADLAVGERHGARIGDPPAPVGGRVADEMDPAERHHAAPVGDPAAPCVPVGPAGHAVAGDGGPGSRQDAGRGDSA